jgi:hypothetical protein
MGETSHAKESFHEKKVGLCMYNLFPEMNQQKQVIFKKALVTKKMLKDANMDVKCVDVVRVAIKEYMYESNQKIDNLGWESITFENMFVGKLNGKAIENTFDYV